MYQVLYRKWRPAKFSDVSGQEPITATLKNEIRTGKISHAYIFTGTRGTGKTTCAKILAKAVNCLHPKDGEPCNECEICRGIDEGTILDVEEIDAASNNGVDNIREIRDEVNFTPAAAKYRVYIIDEVHMLSSGAFNALLKTLEEPPAHVIFILATTEIHKLPATILSRCQRFDFGRIRSEDIAARLQYVASQEKIELDDDAALLIARLSDGALRDALSLLDRCTLGERVTAALVSSIAGLTGSDGLFALSDALARAELAAAFQTIERVYSVSGDMLRLAEQMVMHFRNIMVAKTVGNPAELIVCPAEELQKYMNAAEGFSVSRILEILDCFQETCEKMRTAASRRVEFEMAFVRLLGKTEAGTAPAPAPGVFPAAASSVSKAPGKPPENPLDKAADRSPRNSQPPEKPEERAAEKPMERPPAKAAEKLVENAMEGTVDPDQEKAVRMAEDSAGRYREEDWDAPPWDDDDAPGEREEVLDPAPPQTEGSPAAAGEDAGLRFFAKWPEAIAALGKINRLMASTLKGSEAYEKDGDLILIKAGNPMFLELIRDGRKNKSDIKQAIAEVTGRQYRLGPLKPAQEEQKADPMKAFLSDMRSRGIPIIGKDDEK